MVAITTGILGALLYSTASSALGSWLTPDHGARVGPGGRARRPRRASRAGARGRAPSSSPRPTCPSCSARRSGAGRWRCARSPAPCARRRASPPSSPAVALVGLAGDGRGVDAAPRGRAGGRRRPARACSASRAPRACSARRAGRGPSPSRCPPRWRSAPALVARGERERDRAPGRAVVGTVGLGAAARGRHGTAASLLALALLAGATGARRRRRRPRLRALPDRAPRRPRRGAQRRRGVGLGARRAHGAPVAAAGAGGTRARARHAPARAAATRAGRPVARRDVGAARAPAHARHAPRSRRARRRSRSPPPTIRRPQILAALGSLRGGEHPARAAAPGDRPAQRLARAAAPSLRPHPARPRRRAHRRARRGRGPRRLGVAVAGALPARGGAIAVAAIAVVPAIVLCAALSSRRGGRVPVSVLAMGTTGDPSGGGIVIAWLLAWPAAAVVLGALPLVFVARAHALGSALVLAFAVAAPRPSSWPSSPPPRLTRARRSSRGVLGASENSVSGGRPPCAALERGAGGRRRDRPRRSSTPIGRRLRAAIASRSAAVHCSGPVPSSTRSSSPAAGAAGRRRPGARRRPRRRACGPRPSSPARRRARSPAC